MEQVFPEVYLTTLEIYVEVFGSQKSPNKIHIWIGRIYFNTVVAIIMHLSFLELYAGKISS